MPANQPPERLRELTMDAIVGWIRKLSEDQPVILVIEDLHWADASSLEIVHRLLRKVDVSSLLILMSSRDETVLSDTDNTLEIVSIESLTQKDAHSLLDHVVGDANLPESAINILLARANGVPLFIEELPKPTLEAKKTTSVRGHDQAIVLPATLRDSLMARLDHLGSAKTVAQIGAVLGHSFDYALLRLIWRQSELILNANIEKLVRGSLLIQTGNLPQAHFEFKHALIAEIAYDSLLRRDRRDYHLQAAEALIEHFQELVELRPETVARHYSAAGRGLLAFDFWLKAGQTAARRSGITEAIGHMASAEAELLQLDDAEGKNIDDRWLALHTARGPVLITHYGWAAPQVEQTYRAALTITESLDVHHRLLFNASWGLCSVYLLRGNLQEAESATNRLHDIATASGDRELLLAWRRAAGLSHFLAARFERATEQLDGSETLYEQAQQAHDTATYGANPVVIGCSLKAWSDWFLGRSKNAEQASAAALAAARQTKHPFSLAYALCLSASLAQCQNRTAEALSRSEEALVLSQEFMFPYWQAWGTVIKGWAQAKQGDHDAGLDALKEGMAKYKATGAAQMQGYNLCLLAETFWRAGRWHDAVNMADAAIAETKRSGFIFYQPEAYRLVGESLLKLDRRDRALRMLIEAIRLAEKRNSFPLLLKAAIPLLRNLDRDRLRMTIMTRVTDAMARMEQHVSPSELRATRQHLFSIAERATGA